MRFLREIESTQPFGPFVFFRENFGFVPNIFRAQTLLPRVIEAEARIASVVLQKGVALSRLQKECILLAVAAAHENVYCVTAHAQMLRSLGLDEDRLGRIVTDHRSARLSDADTALLDFALKLSTRPTRVGPADIESLRQRGFTDEPLLESIVVTALTGFLCTLSVGVGAVPDFEPRRVPPRRDRPAPVTDSEAPPPAPHGPGTAGPYLCAADLSAETFQPFAFFLDRFGFIPNIFRAQTLRPDVVEAEAHAVGTILLTDDILSRVRKEYILLVISAANLNTYCVAVHCEMLRALGVSADRSDRIAIDHRRAGLSEADVALLDVALKLAQRPSDFSGADLDRLRVHGFSEEQILEAVVMAALTSFLNTLQMGLGTEPDFPPARVFSDEANLFSPGTGPTEGGRPASAGGVTDDDADASLVARVKEGDADAFEALIVRHHRRIYRTLLGITGNSQDAEDSMQEAFLQAFRHIGEFRGASKFSTWLTRIAINEGLGRLRGQRSEERLDVEGSEPQFEEGEPFRPVLLESWDQNPERIYSERQTRELVEREIMKLPARYRTVVMLRDIEQLSTAEAAVALGLPQATLKTRLLRGRLMLREALAPYFVSRRDEASHV